MLKNTDDRYFQKCVYPQEARRFWKAKDGFEIVITKFPASGLAGNASGETGVSSVHSGPLPRHTLLNCIRTRAAE
jgi:hypothetical protein